MLKEFRADLHIHTCLSPCADIEMSPSAIVKTACEKGIDIIAVTDHNSAENIEAVIRAAKGKGLTVIAGMEVSTVEEVHMIALFESSASLMKLQDIVYSNLLPGENNPEFFGEQVVADEEDTVLGFNDRLLISATNLTVKSLVDIIHSLGGLSIASHIDKEAFSIISQLGFISEDMGIDALEMSPQISFENARQLYSDYESFVWLSSSDAHRLDDIGKRTTIFRIDIPTFEEVVYAVKNINGREAVWR